MFDRNVLLSFFDVLHVAATDDNIVKAENFITDNNIVIAPVDASADVVAEEGGGDVEA